MKYKWLTWSSAIVEINKVPKDFIVNDVCWLTAFLSGSTWKVEISRSSKRRILCYTKNPILQRSTPEKQTCKGLERAFREHWSSPWSLTNSCLSHIHNCTENKIDRAHFPLRGSTKHEMLAHVSPFDQRWAKCDNKCLKPDLPAGTYIAHTAMPTDQRCHICTPARYIFYSATNRRLCT